MPCPACRAYMSGIRSVNHWLSVVIALRYACGSSISSEMMYTSGVVGLTTVLLAVLLPPTVYGTDVLPERLFNSA